MEGARQADADGEGVGAAPDVLRLACDALAQVLIAMQTEDMDLAAAAVHSHGVANGAGDGPPAPTEAGGARWVRGGRLGGSGGAGADRRRRKRTRRAAVALASAATHAASAVASQTQRQSQHLMTLVRTSSSLSFGDAGDDDVSEMDSDELDEGIAINAMELAAYARCMPLLWGYISARLPRLIAERDEVLMSVDRT